MDVQVYLKVASVGFSEGFQLMPGMPMASAVKGDDVFGLVTSQSTEVHVITQDLGVVFVFPSVLRKSFFSYGEYFLCRTCTVNCVQPGE